jgi:glycosyltransferase involved in cell wall biosynthesis
MRVAAIVPALDEAGNIGAVVRGLVQLCDTHGASLLSQVWVVDNGSGDGTAEAAVHAGAAVLREPRRGYGQACACGLAQLARDGAPDAVLFVDGDGQCDPAEAYALLTALSDADLVVGSRRLGRVERGALTLPQRIGNRLASWLIRALWGMPITDLGPYRAIRWSALQCLDMRDRAFGWTVEMQVRTAQRGLRYREVPVACRTRRGRSKISGTVRGVIGAARGILGTIAVLWWRERCAQRSRQWHARSR